jgi:hypothetical protein
VVILIAAGTRETERGTQLCPVHDFRAAEFCDKLPPFIAQNNWSRFTSLSPRSKTRTTVTRCGAWF